LRSRHHKLAKKRGGKNDQNNLVTLPHDFHSAYHSLFGILTPEEAIAFIKIVFREGRREWNVSQLSNLRARLKEG